MSLRRQIAVLCSLSRVRAHTTDIRPTDRKSLHCSINIEINNVPAAICERDQGQLRQTFNKLMFLHAPSTGRSIVLYGTKPFAANGTLLAERQNSNRRRTTKFTTMKQRSITDPGSNHGWQSSSLPSTLFLSFLLPSRPPDSGYGLSYPVGRVRPRPRLLLSSAF